MQMDKQNPNLFGHNPSLLFQFILFEFIAAYKEVQEIEKNYKNLESFLIKNRLISSEDSYLELLLHSITKLSGSSSVNENILFWGPQKGSLNKLRHYSYPFVKQFDSKETTVINLNICVSKAFHSALQAREVIFYLQQESHKAKKMPDYVMLYQLIDKLIDNINRASRLILRIIMRFREDENIVYFLLRNKDALDRIYKINFTTKLFRKMYPNGIEEAKNLLTKKYSERGFSNLLASIEKKISSLGIHS